MQDRYPAVITLSPGSGIYTLVCDHTCMPTEDTHSLLFGLNPAGTIIHQTVSSLQGSHRTYENLHVALHPAHLFSPRSTFHSVHFQSSQDIMGISNNLHATAIFNQQCARSSLLPQQATPDSTLQELRHPATGITQLRYCSKATSHSQMNDRTTIVAR